MSQAISESLPREPDVGRLARSLLDQHLATQVEPLVLADAKMVVSELVNNAYEHGTGQIQLRIRLLDDRLRLEVIDEGHGAAIQVREEAVSGGGRGLRIVQTLSDGWGAFEGTTHVWAEIDTDRGDAGELPL